MSLDAVLTFSRKTGGQLRNAVIVSGLILVYCLTFYTVLCALSAYQILERAKDVAAQKDITVTRLVLEAERLLEDQEREALYRKQIKELNEEIFKQEQSAVESSYRWGEFYDQLDPIVDYAGLDPELLSNPADYRNIQTDVISGLRGQRDAELLVNEFDATLSEFESWQTEETATEHFSKIDSLRKTLTDRNAELATLSKKISADLDIYGEIAMEIRSLRPYFDLLATQPESVLVFALVLAMGALGSTIHITQAFLSGETDQHLTWFLIRPLLGTVTAVAIYILAKAGQLVLDPAKSTATMSPWFISFLAIISGLLSGSAIESISKAGRRFFETAEEIGTPRWGVKLRDRLNTAAVDMKDLAAALGEPMSKLDAWAEAAESVPEDQQRIIAAWLRVPLREIFSDVKP